MSKEGHLHRPSLQQRIAAERHEEKLLRQVRQLLTGEAPPLHLQMTLASCLTNLRWTDMDLADACDVSPRAIRRWHRNPADVPCPIFEWLRKLANFHLNNPPPPPPEKEPTA